MALRLSGGRRLHSPKGEVARPTTARVRQAVMNMFAVELRGCRWLELCGGSGVMACEALQRGAAAVLLVEKILQMVETLLQVVLVFKVLMVAVVMMVDMLVQVAVD